MNWISPCQHSRIRIFSMRDGTKVLCSTEFWGLSSPCSLVLISLMILTALLVAGMIQKCLICIWGCSTCGAISSFWCLWVQRESSAHRTVYQARCWAVESPARLLLCLKRVCCLLWFSSQGISWSLSMLLLNCRRNPSPLLLTVLPEGNIKTDVCLKCCAAYVRPSVFCTAESVLLFHALWAGLVWCPLVFPQALMFAFGSLFVQMALRCPFIPPTCCLFV